MPLTTCKWQPKRIQVGYRGDNGCCKRYSTVRQALRRFLVEFILAPLSFFYSKYYITFNFMPTQPDVSYRFISNYFFIREVSLNRTEAPKYGSKPTALGLGALYLEHTTFN